jgi:hypothetical protein
VLENHLIESIAQPDAGDLEETQYAHGILWRNGVVIGNRRIYLKSVLAASAFAVAAAQGCPAVGLPPRRRPLNGKRHLRPPL